MQNYKEYLEKQYESDVTVDQVLENYLECTISESVFRSVFSFFKKSTIYFLSDMTCVDYKDHFMMFYQLFSTQDHKHLCIKMKVADYDNPQVPTLTGLWQTANWHEREIYDLMGIDFPGHPDMKRILMWEGYQGYPLRKDFIINPVKKSWEVT